VDGVQPSLATEDPPMTDSLPRPEQAASPDPGPSAGPPRWVKVFGIIALAVVVVVVVLLLTRGGHGPSRHSGDSALSGETSGHRLLSQAYA
jgi:hypothetical protein